MKELFPQVAHFSLPKYHEQLVSRQQASHKGFVTKSIKILDSKLSYFSTITECNAPFEIIQCAMGWPPLI